MFVFGFFVLVFLTFDVISTFPTFLDSKKHLFHFPILLDLKEHGQNSNLKHYCYYSMIFLCLFCFCFILFMFVNLFHSCLICSCLFVFLIYVCLFEQYLPVNELFLILLFEHFEIEAEFHLMAK